MTGRTPPPLAAEQKRWAAGAAALFLIAIGFLAGEGLGLKADPQADVVSMKPKVSCTSCGSFDMRMIEGCMTCASCGHSKCG